MLNEGNLAFDARSFTATTPYALEDIALGDVDNDGDLDAIAVCGFGSPNILMINAGDGMFTATALPILNSGSGDNSRAAAFGDFSGDGYIDAVVGNLTQGNQLLINNGSGGFSSVLLPGGIYTSYQNSIAVGDFDGDQDLDIVLSNLNQGARLLINTGNDTSGIPIFEVSTITSVSSDAYRGIAVGDLNGDGRLDVLLGGAAVGRDKILINNDSGYFVATNLPLPPDSVYGVSDTYAIALGDVDNDGDYDAVLGRWLRGEQRNCIMINEGLDSSNNVIFSYRSLPGGPLVGTASDVALADLDSDNDLDIIIGYDSTYSAPEVLRNDGNPAFVPSQLPTGDVYAFGLAVGNLDGGETAASVNQYGLPDLGTEDLLPGFYPSLLTA